MTRDGELMNPGRLGTLGGIAKQYPTLGLAEWKSEPQKSECHTF